MSIKTNRTKRECNTRVFIINKDNTWDIFSIFINRKSTADCVGIWVARIIKFSKHSNIQSDQKFVLYRYAREGREVYMKGVEIKNY